MFRGNFRLNGTAEVLSQKEIKRVRLVDGRRNMHLTAAGQVFEPKEWTGRDFYSVEIQTSPVKSRRIYLIIKKSGFSSKMTG